MSRKKEPRVEPAEALPPDLNMLLEEIEKEAVPEKLLALAMKLQEALVERRLREGTAQVSPEKAAARNLVKQP